LQFGLHIIWPQTSSNSTQQPISQAQK
jgi:hypothetical protein